MSDIVKAESFSDRFSKLVRMDRVRVYRMIELAIFTVGYMVVGGLFGTMVDQMFPAFDAKISNEQLAKEILLQLIVIVISVFYLRKIVRLLPLGVIFRALGASGYRSGETTETNGELIISLVFITMQPALVSKVLEARSRFRKYMGFDKTEKK